MNNLIPQKHYKEFLNQLIVSIKNSQYKAYQAVNRHLVDMYWVIGKQLHDKIEVAKWGEGVVEKLSLDLQREFPGMPGFSKENVWRMKRLYETYSAYEKLSPLVTELAWSHNIIILSQAKTIREREFYIKMCISEHWSKRELEKQFSNCLYEKTVDSDSGSKLIPHTLEKDPSAHFRDEYNLGFLGLKEPFSEKDLQTAIVHNLRDFFLEFGKHLSFIGEEYPVTVVGTEQ